MGIFVAIPIVVFIPVTRHRREQMIKCEQINTCDFVTHVSRIMPFTAKIIKSTHCENIGYGCAKDQEHLILPIDQEPGNLFLDVKEPLEIFEKQYSEKYKELHVRNKGVRSK